MYFSGSQSLLLMSKNSITSGFPDDLRETYRLLLRYPIVWVTIVGGLLSIGIWLGNLQANLTKNEASIVAQEEMKAIRDEERERCDKIMKDYKELVDKFLPKEIKNEK